MMQVEVFGESTAMVAVAESLDGLEGVSRVRRTEAVRDGHSIVVAAVRPRAVDPLLEELRRLDVPDADTTVTRVEVVDWTATRESEVSLVWADVLGQAWINARPIARYLTLMAIAGVIACYGVTDGNVILIIGAMAVSPDLLPITAIGVSIVGRRPRLAGQALFTLALGLVVVIGAAALFAFAQNQLDLIPSGFSLSNAANALGGLATVSDETIVVAFVAGAAGMLALETRASSAVGVAVSVTTIPAAAYLGVAAGVGGLGEAEGAVGVLGLNVLMMSLGASVTLIVQRRVRRRAQIRRGAQPGLADSSDSSDASRSR